MNSFSLCSSAVLKDTQQFHCAAEMSSLIEPFSQSGCFNLRDESLCDGISSVEPDNLYMDGFDWKLIPVTQFAAAVGVIVVKWTPPST